MSNQSQNNISNQLGTAPVGRLLLKLAAPMVVAQLVNLLYNVVDRIYIGHMPEVGRVALTGVGLCLPIVTLITAFTMLIAQGGAPRAAIAMGEGNNERAQDHGELFHDPGGGGCGADRRVLALGGTAAVDLRVQ